MKTRSYISAAALTAALLISPQTTQAQILGLDVNVDVLGVETDANVDVGGDSLLDADVDIGSSGTGESAAAPSHSGSLFDVDVDIGHGSATGPNGGTLIDLGGANNAVLDAGIKLLDNDKAAGSSALITGDIRIAALDKDARKDALLDLIEHPNLADIDLDAVIDDRHVAIVALADLLGHDDLADISAAIDLGGEGRLELLDALSASAELTAILGNQGINPSDVLAVQVGDNGATEVIVLDGVVEVALLGDDLTAGELADLDIDLLSRDELAEIDLDLLPDDLRTSAQLRLLGSDGDDADLTPAELAAIDLDLLSHDELAELDVDLLPAPLGAAVNLHLLAEDGDLTDRSIGDLAALDLSLLPAGDNDSGSGNTGNNDNTGGNGGDGSTSTPTGGTTGTDTTTTGSTSGSDTDGAGAPQTGGAFPKPIGGKPAVAANGPAAPALGTMPPSQVGASFGIATLDCDIGTLALASGLEATPQAIAGAATLELVRIDGCQRNLIDAEIDTIRAAIARNPAISGVLDNAEIPLDQVIGATIQDDTLTLFIEPSLS